MSFSNLTPTYVLEKAKIKWNRNLRLVDIYYEGPLGARRDTLILNLTNGSVYTGCFNGTMKGLEAKIKFKYGRVKNRPYTDYRDEYMAALPRFKAALEGVNAEPVVTSETLAPISFSDRSPSRVLEAARSMWRPGGGPALEDIYYEGPIGIRHDTLILNLQTGTAWTGCFHGTIDELEKRLSTYMTDPQYSRELRRGASQQKAYLDALPRFRQALEAYRQRRRDETTGR